MSEETDSRKPEAERRLAPVSLFGGGALKVPTLSEIRAHIDSMVAKGYRFTKRGVIPPPGTPEIIIVDYVQMIKPPNSVLGDSAAKEK